MPDDAPEPADTGERRQALPARRGPGRPRTTGRPPGPLDRVYRLSKSRRRAVEALLQEATVSRASILAGVSERTMRRYMEEVPFQRAYHAARRSAFGQAVGLMQKFSPVAVQTLVQVMTDAKVHPAARVAAAATLLKFGREGIELDDLALRLEALEKEAEEARNSKAKYAPNTWRD